MSVTAGVSGITPSSIFADLDVKPRSSLKKLKDVTFSMSGFGLCYDVLAVIGDIGKVVSKHMPSIASVRRFVKVSISCKELAKYLVFTAIWASFWRLCDSIKNKESKATIGLRGLILLNFAIRAALFIHSFSSLFGGYTPYIKTMLDILALTEDVWDGSTKGKKAFKEGSDIESKLEKTFEKGELEHIGEEDKARLKAKMAMIDAMERKNNRMAFISKVVKIVASVIVLSYFFLKMPLWSSYLLTIGVALVVAKLMSISRTFYSESLKDMKHSLKKMKERVGEVVENASKKKEEVKALDRGGMKAILEKAGFDKKTIVFVLDSVYPSKGWVHESTKPGSGGGLVFDHGYI